MTDRPTNQPTDGQTRVVSLPLIVGLKLRILHIINKNQLEEQLYQSNF